MSTTRNLILPNAFLGPSDFTNFLLLLYLCSVSPRFFLVPPALPASQLHGLSRVRGEFLSPRHHLTGVAKFSRVTRLVPANVARAPAHVGVSKPPAHLSTPRALLSRPVFSEFMVERPWLFSAKRAENFARFRRCAAWHTYWQ